MLPSAENLMNITTKIDKTLRVGFELDLSAIKLDSEDKIRPNSELD